MAIIKTYKPRVGISADAGTGRAIDTGASQMWGQAGQAIGAVANVVGQFKRKQDEISTLQGDVKYASAVKLRNAEITKALQKESVRSEGAERTDEQLTKVLSSIDTTFNNQINNEILPLIKDPRRHAQIVALEEEGAGEYGRVTRHIAYEKYRSAEFIRQGDITAATFADAQDEVGFNAWISRYEKSAGPEAAEKARVVFDKAKKKVRSEKMYSDATIDPAQVIKQVDDQMTGKATTWNGASPEELKATRSYAKMQLAENQIEVANSMYEPKSEYQSKTPAQKKTWLGEQHALGNISTPTYKTELELVQNPRYIDQNTDNRSDLLSYAKQLRLAGGDSEKIAKILDKANAEMMPQEFKRELNQMGVDLLDPNSSYYSTQNDLVRNLFTNAFAEEDMVPEVTSLLGRTKGWVGKPVTPSGYSVLRDELLINAEFEAKESVRKWMETEGGADASQEEITKRVSKTILETKQRYGIPLLRERMQELVLEDEAQEEAVEASAEPEEQKTDVELVLEVNPGWDKAKALLYLKSIGR